jgi:hypothetical protein
VVLLRSLPRWLPGTALLFADCISAENAAEPTGGNVFDLLAPGFAGFTCNIGNVYTQLASAAQQQQPSTFDETTQKYSATE